MPPLARGVAAPHDARRLHRPAGFDGTGKPDVLGHRPGQWRRRAGRLAGLVAVWSGRWILLVPDLLGDHVAVVGGVGHRAQERQPVAAVGDRVLAALTAEQRPGAPLSPRRVEAPRGPVVLLAVAVERVAVPYASAGRVCGKRRVGLRKGGRDVAIVRCLDAEADEVEEAGVDDLIFLVHARRVAEVTLGAVVGVAV